VACGTGRLAPFFLTLGASLTGVDVSPAMLAAARGHGLEHAAWVAGDAQRLPFASRSFDVVVTTRFLRHLDASARAPVLREVARVARRFVVVETLLGIGLVWRWKRLTKGSSWTGAVSPKRPTAESFEAELRSCGLRVVSRHALIALVSQPHVFVCEKSPVP